MKPCSRCHGDNPRPTQRYCAPCHRVYMREWRDSRRWAEAEKFNALVRSIQKIVTRETCETQAAE